MKDGLRINPRILIPEAELRFSFAASGGPGGQHVNKTATKVELRWNLEESTVISDHNKAWLFEQIGGKLTEAGDLIVTSSDHRSQHRNKKEARAKLASLLAEALIRPTVRKPTRPSRGSVEKRIKGKKQTSQKKRGRAWKPED